MTPPQAIMLAASTIATIPAAAVAARVNAVFCSASAGAQVLAVATTGEGKLRFGVSVWTPEGNNISVFGVADPVPSGWRYAETNGRCIINFARNADGGFTVQPDGTADCHMHAGQGARIGTLHFSASEKEGPVTTELNDPEAFQHAGHCAGSR
jgi:hypothetical protein